MPESLPRVVALTAVLLALAGCVEELPETPAPTNDAKLVEPAPLPEAVHASQQVLVGHDPYNAVFGAPCSRAQSTCYRYPFEITAAQNATGTIQVAAKLGWTVDTNDFDLYLFRGDAETGGAGNTGAPGLEESFNLKVYEGKWDIVVVAWATVADAFTLDAEFTRAASPQDDY